jgi:putative transposase
MEYMDKQYLSTPYYGVNRMVIILKKKGHAVGPKRIRRLMRQMCLIAQVPGPHTSKGRKEHKKYPYLLKDVKINRSNQAWATDITYIPTLQGYLYLVAIMDLYSRKILSWRLSNNLESDFCVEALVEAFKYGLPEIFNSDQGVQFTSTAFTQELLKRGIKISMDGKGHYWDNILVERLWRTIKYEEVYLKNYEAASQVYEELSEYLRFYDTERPHASLGNTSPNDFYLKGFEEAVI